MLGILCGLESEAAIARQIAGASIACAAARPQKARWLARELVKKGATRLMSFGIAGALEPGLPIGSLIIGTQVISVDGTWDCDGPWISQLSQRMPEAHCGPVWGSETLVPTAVNKLTLYKKSRCLIVDMESQCAAQIASEAKLPLAVIRVVCDNADMDVPQLVMSAIAEDGHISALTALWSVLRNPTQIPDLIRVACGTSKAHRVLKACAPAVAVPA
jgi:hopanoid-associated phosphorylase